jgi:hypothetical protein
MRQVEVSRTLVLDAPRRARAFLETQIADNFDIGRPASVELGGVVVNVFGRHWRIRQYLKDGRAMRIETVIDALRDQGCNARLRNLDELQARARACNYRMLDAPARAPSFRTRL